MTMASQMNAADLRPKFLPPSVRHGLRALAVAGGEFEPFVDWIVDSNVIEQLLAAGLAEKGDSNRPSVGPVGYRLTELGWRSVGSIWGFHRGRGKTELSA